MSTSKTHLSIDVDIRQALGQVILLLNGGNFVEGENLLSELIRHYVGEPGKSLIRLFQIDANPRLAQPFDEFKEIVESMGDKRLTVCFQTIVGPWAVDEADTPNQTAWEKAYIHQADGVELSKQVRLFESKSDDLLWVQLWNENELCNYRCPYCFLKHRDQVDVKRISRFAEIIDRLHLIPRPLALHMGARGEVLVLPDLWPLYAKVAALPNLRFVEFWSNLSRPLDGVFKHISPSKLNVVATYHPTQYKKESDKTNFFDRVMFLRDNANDVVIHFVHSRENAPYIPEIIKTAKAMGVHLVIKPMIGMEDPETGQPYPKAYKHKDILRLRKWHGCDLAVHFAYEHGTNLRCNAGKDLIHIRNDGNVSRCEYSHYPSPVHQNYGNILDEGGPTIDTVGRYCFKGGCSGYDVMGHSAPYVAEYRREKCSVRFIRRKPGEIGTRSYD